MKEVRAHGQRSGHRRPLSDIPKAQVTKRHSLSNDFLTTRERQSRPASRSGMRDATWSPTSGCGTRSGGLPFLLGDEGDFPGDDAFLEPGSEGTDGSLSRPKGMSLPLEAAPSGTTRKVPGRKGVTWEEADWVDKDATAHRAADE